MSIEIEILDSNCNNCKRFGGWRSAIINEKLKLKYNV